MFPPSKMTFKFSEYFNLNEGETKLDLTDMHVWYDVETNIKDCQ